MGKGDKEQAARRRSWLAAGTLVLSSIRTAFLNQRGLNFRNARDTCSTKTYYG